MVCCRKPLSIWQVMHCFCRGIVRGQSNTAEHDPEYCQDKYEQWGSAAEPKCPMPVFAGGFPQVYWSRSATIFQAASLCTVFTVICFSWLKESLISSRYLVVGCPILEGVIIYCSVPDKFNFHSVSYEQFITQASGDEWSALAEDINYLLGKWVKVMSPISVYCYTLFFIQYLMNLLEGKHESQDCFHQYCYWRYISVHHSMCLHLCIPHWHSLTRSRLYRFVKTSVLL